MKIGILGGGQLGKMLYTPANKLDLDIHFMDSMLEGPVSKVAKHYHVGKITSFDDVINFGNTCDVVSIEIEKVNTEALKELEERDILVYPQASIIELIQDKGLQKDFYADRQLPTSDYKKYEHKKALLEDVKNGTWSYPFVQKLRRDGYDGRGVKIIRNEEDIKHGFEQPFIVESMVPIEKELGVVTCRNAHGEIIVYDPVEMVFHPEQNILLYQLGPALIPQSVNEQAIKIARDLSEAFGIVGLLAVEMFWTQEGNILINEVAPRPHNSGHHTIEACYTSQYENHLRALTGRPFGSANTRSKSLLMNILGHPDFKGPVHYEGLNKILGIEGINVHLYGKTETKPFRKMGHINIVGESYDQLINHYNFINEHFRVISK